jgi:hypothetical protein
MAAIGGILAFQPAPRHPWSGHGIAVGGAFGENGASDERLELL